ncbi:hypothetical protein PybrP1_001606 [[Pythium] brassicae (nom. inval.)]|nr:hypothetical protein PybrP1_001606 [[Pythium] brassicae (nom. inval.)]
MGSDHRRRSPTSRDDERRSRHSKRSRSRDAATGSERHHRHHHSHSHSRHRSESANKSRSRSRSRSERPEPMAVDAAPGEAAEAATVQAKLAALQFEQLEAVRNVELITRNEYPLEHLQRRQLVNRDYDDDDEEAADGGAVCYCTYPDAADADKTRCDDVSCLNFATYVECNANCPAREFCRNQRLQQPELFPKLEAFKKELTLRLKSAPRNELNFYYLLLEPGVYIDARNKGCFTRFVNHSCEPNCKTEKWTVKGETRIAVVALRDIGQSEELTFDYQWKSLGSRHIKCLCESANCKGVIGSEADAAKSDEPNGVFREPEKSEAGAAIAGRRIRIFKSPDDHSLYYIATVKRCYDDDDDDDDDDASDADGDSRGPDASPNDKTGERFVRLSEMDWQIFVELDGMSDAQIEKAVFSIPKRRVAADQLPPEEPSPKAHESGTATTAASREPSPTGAAPSLVAARTVSNVAPGALKRNLDGEVVDGEGNVITTKLLVKGISIKCDAAAVRRLFVVDDRRHRASAGSAPPVVTDMDMFFFDDDSGWALVEFTDATYAGHFKRKLNARPLEGKTLRVFHAGRKEVENFHNAKRNFALRRHQSSAAAKLSASASAGDKPAAVVGKGDAPKAVVPYCFGRQLNWQVSVEQMEDSPSRRQGISLSLEQSLRATCVKLIQRLMKKLHLEREDATSAVIALNRYLTFHAMNVRNVEYVAAAILYVFVRAHARKCSWVAFVSEVHAAKTASSSSSAEATKQLSDASDEFKATERLLLAVEKEVLEGLRYDLSSEDPYAMLEALVTSRRSKRGAGDADVPTPPADVVREAKQLVSDSLRLPIWVQTPVACIVLSILYVSAAVTRALKESPSDTSATTAIPSYLPALDGRRNELESLMLLECALSLSDSLKDRWVRLEKIAKASRRASQSDDFFDTEQFAVVRGKPVEVAQRISYLLKAWINVPSSGSSGSRGPSPSPEADLPGSRKSDEFITLSSIDKSFVSLRVVGARSASSSAKSKLGADTDDNTEVVAAAHVVPKQVAKGPGGGSTTVLSSADRLQTTGITHVELIRKRVLLGTVRDDLPFDLAGQRVFLQPWPTRDHVPAFSAAGAISKSCVRELSAAIALSNKFPRGFVRLLGIVFPEEKKPPKPLATAAPASDSAATANAALDVDMLELSADAAKPSLASSLNRLDSAKHYLAFEQPLHMYAGIFEAKLKVPFELKRKAIFDMLQSLSACHAHGFVHRFVSPTHLFLFKHGAKLGGYHTIRKATASKTRDSSGPVFEMSETERKELGVGSWVAASAPELLLGDCHFSWRCDIWSAGCLALAILLDNVALLLGADAKVQVDKIFRLCGTPSVECEAATKLPLYRQFRPKGEYKKRLRKTLTESCAERQLALPEDALVLLECMLQLDPAKRKSAAELLALDFFRGVADAPRDAVDFSALPDTFRVQQRRMLAQLKAAASKAPKRRRPASEHAASASASASASHHRSSRHHSHRKPESDARARPSASKHRADADTGDDVPLPAFFALSADASTASTTGSSSSKGLLSPARPSRPEKRAKLGWGMGLHSDAAR